MPCTKSLLRWRTEAYCLHQGSRGDLPFRVSRSDLLGVHGFDARPCGTAVYHACPSSHSHERLVGTLAAWCVSARPGRVPRSLQRSRAMRGAWGARFVVWMSCVAAAAGSRLTTEAGKRPQGSFGKSFLCGSCGLLPVRGCRGMYIMVICLVILVSSRACMASAP